MSDLLPAAVWREVEKASTNGLIALVDLRKILRKSRRSLDQNSAIHALFDETIEKGGEALRGWTREDVKEWALGEYWGWDKFEALGRTRLKPKKRSSSMTKTEASDFMTWYVAKMNDFGIPVSLPDDPVNT